MGTIKNSFIKLFLCVAFLLIAMMLPQTSYAADTAGNYMDVSEYRSGDTYTYPTKRGYVFAGWYRDAEFTTALGEKTKNGFAYAKFVDADVLSVKCQILADTQETTEGTTDLKMVTTVDSLKYSSVGFRTQFDSYDITTTTTKVYKKITSYGYKNSSEEFINYEPSYFSEDSLYFAAYTVTGFPMSYLTTDITVTPMWTTLDGTTVIGTAKTFNFKDAIKVYEGYVAKIEDTYYTSFAEAVVAADDNYTADVMVTLLTDVTYSDVDSTAINNSSDNVVTINGNGNKVTTSSESTRVFTINKSAGSVTFNNITFDHQATSQVIHITSNTTVNLTDVNIYATNNASGVYEYSVIMFKAGGSQEATLNLTRTHIVMKNDYAGKSDSHGYLCGAILTNTSDQTSGKNVINITMENSEIDVTAAEKRAGICLTYGTTGNIKLMNSKITTKNNYAIYSRVKSTDTSVKAVANVTLLDNVVLTSLDDTYNIDYSAYGYGKLSIGEGTLNFGKAPEIAKVGETYYTSLADAFTAASAYTKDVTVELLQDVSECTASCTITGDADNTVTFNGNGYTIGTTGSNRIFTVSKTAGNVEFENIIFNHESTNRFMRIDKPITVDFTDVNIYADSDATNDELIVFATAWDETTSTLNLTRTYIKMTVPDTNIGGTSDQGPTCAVISTGTDDQSYKYKTVNITMIDSEIDATEANNRAGICLRFTTTSNIKLVNSKITTQNNYAIFSRVRYNTDSSFRTSGKANITLSGDVTLESQTAAYNVDYSSAGYGTLSVGEVEAYNQGNVKFVTSTNVAQIGDTYYTSLKSAIEYANASGADETIELLTDIGGSSAVDFAQLSINNENGQTITIDGNGHSITTLGTSNSIEVYQSSGTVELKDLTIYHNGTNALVRTRNAVTLKVTDVDIYATNGAEGVFYNYLFNISGEGTSYLNMSNVNVEAINSHAADSKAGVIRTGADSTVTKTVYITMTNCNIDLDQATGRTGIMIMGSTTAYIDLSNTTIATVDTYAIRPNGQTLTYTGCTFSSVSEYYNQYPIEGCNAKIGNTCYSLKKALEVANASEEDVTITLMYDISADSAVAFSQMSINNANSKKITIDGNGHSITTSGSSNSIEVHQTGGTVELKNLTVYHNATNALVRTRNAVTLNVTNVDVFATSNEDGVFDYYIFNISGTGTTSVNMEDVKVEVKNEYTPVTEYAGVIRTGTTDDKAEKVYITLKDCNMNLKEATGRTGIQIMDTTDAYIELTNTTIETQDIYCIRPAGEDLTLTDCTLTSQTDKYNSKPIEGYVAQVGTTWYSTFSDAVSAALESEKDVTVSLYADVSQTATIDLTGESTNAFALDGNGYTITTTGDNRLFTIKKTAGSVTFENMNFEHQTTNVLMRIDTDITVGFTDVEISAENTEGTENDSVVIKYDMTTDGAEATLNLTGVNIKLVNMCDGYADENGYMGGVIRTGEEAATVEKTVNINMVDSIITSSGEYENPGICVAYDTTVNISLDNSSVVSDNCYAIYARQHATDTAVFADVNVTLTDNSVIHSDNTSYQNDVYDGLSLGGAVINVSYSESVYTNRIILVSDTHYTPDGDTILGYSTSQRMTALKTDLNNFMASNYVDAVLTLGDLSTDNGTVSNYTNGYVYKYKTDVLDKLSCATNSSLKTYALPGNHDGYSDNMWNSVFGYNRRSYFTVGDNALFIMLDTYDVSGYSDLSAITSAGSDYTGVDVEWLETVVAKFPDRQIFLCSHYVDTAVEGTELQTFLSENDNVVCMFMGHDHGNNITLTESLANKFLVNVSAYSYKTKRDVDGTYNFNYFDAKWAWGFGVLEWNDEEVHYYHVKNPRTYVGVNGTVDYAGAIEDAFTKKI